jgi:2-polyprenyl-3-methyl-5-hydroxy-6-metoxy-1,4-benzoquinol methylase
MTRIEMIREFCRDKVVLDLGCVNHDIENAESEGWLHKTVVDVSREALGIDYLEPEVDILKKRGFQVMWGDVTKPLATDRKFDVIVVGHLIEHLSSFDGLMTNLRRLLAPGGVVLICTPNPFFREQYFYAALKNDFLVNPEHTCWIDPVTLDQLSRRFGLETAEVRWIKEKWHLSETIFNGERQSFDMFAGKWTYVAPSSLLEKIVSPWLAIATRMFIQPDRRLRAERRYGDDLGRFQYMRFKGVFVDFWWWLRRSVIPTSDINRHEAFMSVLKLSKAVTTDEPA